MESQDATAEAAQCIELELDDSTVLYDGDNTEAWLQSDGAVACETMV